MHFAVWPELALAARSCDLPNGNWLLGNNNAKKLDKNEPNQRERQQIQVEHGRTVPFTELLRVYHSPAGCQEFCIENIGLIDRASLVRLSLAARILRNRAPVFSIV